jgi:hypothetical protein
LANGARTRKINEETTTIAVASRRSPGVAGRFHKNTVRSPIAASVIQPPHPDNRVAEARLHRMIVFLLTSLTTRDVHWTKFDEDFRECGLGPAETSHLG